MVASENLTCDGCFSADTMVTLVDILHGRAIHQPDKKAFTFLVDGETQGDSLTYRELDLQARAIAALLQSLVKSGERALLMYPPGLDFIAAFFGCLYAGIIAIPAYPPRSNNRSIERIQAIVEDAEAKVVLSTTDTLSNLRHFGDIVDSIAVHVLTSDTVAIELAQTWQAPTISGETLAYLQYTSGSTSKPKGATISHGNVMANSEHIAIGWETSSDSVLVSWLPHFHDFGLVYAIIQPVYMGFPCILMAPTSFIQQPIRWLQAISRYRATHTGAPNFAYELCVKKITPEQRATLDLSSWRVAINGAEPIRPETLQNFVEVFESCGFRWSTLRPAYGLAEVVLKISGIRKKEMPIFYSVKASELEKHQIIELSRHLPGVRTLVGCGSTVLDMKVVIVNPTSRTQCLPNQVGEIWVSSKSVAHGYWNRPEETEYTFRAYLADTREGPFLRTGDLGFIKDGQLFITGRLKDLIIIRGHNHYPQDIELTAEQSHSALRPSCSAAFPVDVNGEERVAIAAEVERTYLRRLNVDEVIEAIRQAVSQEHELQVYAVLLLKPGSIPKTSSGKIQRSACRAGFLAGSLSVVGDWNQTQETEAKLKHLQAEVETLAQELQTHKQNSSFDQNNSTQPSSTQKASQTVPEIQAWLVSKIAEQLKVNPENIDVREPFASYRLDSMAAVSLTGELENWLKRRLSPTLVYDYPNIEALAGYVGGESVFGLNFQVEAQQKTQREAIAIIGLGCRFPHANNPEAFWQLLRSGVDAITEVPGERWNIDAFYDSNRETPGKMSTRWGGFLDQVDQFDPLFFGIAPREAEGIDPQQRLLLEVAWEALENAAIAPDKLAGSKTGVFIGISTNDYSRLQFEDYHHIDAYAGTSNAYSITANRLSYLLDLRGPSLAVDTACSSSLVAVHLACQSLYQRESHMALVGGVNLILSPELNITFSKAQMMAADGRCKTFDASADGYVRGEGCGLVVLKRLSDALRDGDSILALIKGSAINQDGRSNGLTAPNGPSQQAVIHQALENAGLTPAQLSYVETHGTGTPLGDPIEVESLKAVLMSNHFPDQPCAIGSVKANIGHLEAAAGIASLIKVVLSLQHGELPAQLHLNQLNPHISFENTSFFIPKELQPWLANQKRRFAGVSSFGFGGTNAHVVLEESPAPTKTDIDVDRPLHILTLSAKTNISLQSLTRSYQKFLEQHPAVSLADVCFTANTGRSHFAHRLAIATASTGQLHKQLGAFATGGQTSGLFSGQVQSRNHPKIAFLFTGQGSQYPSMGRRLYETQPTFRQALERCDELLRPYLQQPLLSLLYPTSETSPLLHETVYTQPALFSLEYALAELWRSWGIVPDAVMGHSLGEYVAACVAGVFSLEDGLKLIVERSRLMQSLPPIGEMAVVFASYKQVVNTLTQYQKRVAIAAVNGSENIVISGMREDVQSVLRLFKSEEIAVQSTQVSHAFHSSLVDPILDEFECLASKVKFQTPSIPLISNLTGQMFKPGEIPDATYWRCHMRETVEFSAGMQTLADQGYDLFIELGPQSTLLGMGKRCLPKGIGTWLPSLNKNQDNWQTLLDSLAALYVKGVNVDWAGFDRDYARYRTSLPTYPWQRERYWLKKSTVKQQSLRLQKQPLWESVVSAGDRQSQQGPLDLGVHTYPAELGCLDSLTTSYIICALQKLGAYTQTGEKHSVDSLLEQFNISSIYRKLLRRWLERLTTENLLQQQEETFVCLRPLPETCPNSILREARKQWSNAAPILDFMQRCGENLAAVLVGDANPVDLLFPAGSFETAEGIYQHTPVARYFDGIARSVVESVVQTLPQNKQLQILEIGAGTGGTTASLLPVMPPERTLYSYTDLSGLFLARAKQKFKTYPFVRYGVLDIEQNPIEQGYETQSFDVVVAANVLHATSNLGETLKHLRSLLAPNGLLLIWEVTHPQSWLDITFALFDGWQRFDDQLRQDSPLLSPKQWETVLKSHGFSEVAVFPDSGSPAAVLGQNILVAQAPTSVTHIDSHASSGLLNRNGYGVVTENLNNWLYELKWQSQALLEGKPSESGIWLIFADRGGVGQHLAGLLAQRGEKSVLVSPGEAYERIDEGYFRIHPQRREDMRQLLEIALAGQPPCSKVVHLWSLDVPPEETTVASLETAQTLGCSSVLHLVQELERGEWGETVRLWLVTQGVQMVEEKPVSLAIAQAPLWGLGRTIVQEHPALWGGLVDLDPQAPVDDAAALLCKEIWNSDGEDQLAFRQGQRYVARLVRKRQSTPPEPQALRPDGSYLITGGLGELGLLVAQWMVEQGARRIVLLGRTQIPDRTTWNQVEKGSRLAKQIAAIQKLESQGAKVYLASVDVASENQLNSFMEAFHHSGWPSIRGVVHTAGVVQDRTLLQLDTDSLMEVLRPKVVGGWLLHRLLENTPLDFFVLFSSLSSLLAQPGQGNYAAANAFLDALAYYRQAEGRVALSINWGAWADLGFAATPGGRRLTEHLARLGIKSIEPKHGLELLERLLQQSSVQVGVLPVNWSQLRDFYPASRKLPLLSYLLHDEINVFSEAESLKRKERLTRNVVLNAEPGEQQRLLQSYLGEQVARVLGLTTSQLDVQQPLNNLGLDSLMAVEIKNLIENDLGVVVPIANFLQGSCVVQLAGQVFQQLTTAAVTHNHNEQKVNDLDLIGMNNTEDLLAKLDQLSEEKVDLLLNSILAEKEVSKGE
ncbi:beta-ketoacyl synthase N-terminal-like domain-containing protein [Nostoc sp.]|uniref:beta-ketoacyl synthase N-terminal-like domain-containing protein n=1 Tax=Nostoc sp. TaxID=1180 RepID=UPI002FF4FE7E